MKQGIMSYRETSGAVMNVWSVEVAADGREDGTLLLVVVDASEMCVRFGSGSEIRAGTLGVGTLYCSWWKRPRDGAGVTALLVTRPMGSVPPGCWPPPTLPVPDAADGAAGAGAAAV